MIEVVAGLFAVSMIAVVAIISHPEQDNMFVLTIVGSAFTIIAALLGVHYSIRFMNGEND